MSLQPESPYLYVLRHAETEWNQLGLIQGRTDTKISESALNLLQNGLIGSPYLKWKLYSSPLERCRQTARVLFQREADIVAAAIERNFGIWEGQPYQTYTLSLPESENEFGWQGLDHKPEGGESMREVRDRLQLWLKQFHGQNNNSCLVSHKGIILALYSLAWDWNFDKKRPHKVLYDRAHLFQIDAHGKPSIVQSNMQLI